LSQPDHVNGDNANAGHAHNGHDNDGHVGKTLMTWRIWLNFSNKALIDKISLNRGQLARRLDVAIQGAGRTVVEPRAIRKRLGNLFLRYIAGRAFAVAFISRDAAFPGYAHNIV
jgi:hypothetical protein